MKVVIADPKSGKSYQIEIDENKAKPIYGMKIGDELDGALLGLTGYKLEITGGSDKDGFPMRRGFHGSGRKSLLISAGPGIRAKGKKLKKTVRGEKVAEDIAQLNVKVKTYGSKDIKELLGIEEKKESKE
ncbi:30S ribosomal protein S6e [Candidatus Micrarchaeota archaeon]|mgnify:CR=1 FL=1|nr:MAG: 30S ribosomal protein S6e [Candidatus Micrarchaeota archaeon]